MNKIVLSIAAVAALAGGAVPAMAQGRGGGLDNRIDALQQQIQRGVQRGTITRNEAQPLRDRLRAVKQLERQYSRGGFTRAEQSAVQQRIQRLRDQIRFADTHGNGGRGYGRR